MSDFAITAEPEDEVEVADYKVLEVEEDFVNAKTFLQKGSNVTGDNLYDHLTELLNKILDERPENVIDFFEEYSRKVREKRFRPMTDHLEDIYVSAGRYQQAKKWEPLLKPPQPDEPSTVDPEDVEVADMARNNLLLLLYYFEQAGLGLPKKDVFVLLLSVMSLIKRAPISTVRFWGKVSGLYKDYYILETELSPDEIVKRNELEQQEREAAEKLRQEKLEAQRAAEAALQEMQGEEQQAGKGAVPRKLPPKPEVVFEELPDPPDESLGVGVNRKTYFVCNEPGDEWVELPKATAYHIRVARMIRKSFTGMLEEPVVTYPAFNGNESNYLRAQIARISAGTQISPLGYYTFGGGGEVGEEEEEEEEEVGEEEEGGGRQRTSFKENRRFQGLPIRDLLDGSMTFWVHHAQYILPQGRTTWWNPVKPEVEMGEEEELGEEEEDEEDVKPKKTAVEPETGPPLLTPLSEDSSMEAVPAWSVRQSAVLTPAFAIVVVRSNVWPGAFCFATQGKLFENVYLGDGLKYTPTNFSPKPLPPVQQEYPLGPEIMEVEDPSGAEEEAWRVAHLPKVKEKDEEEEEEEVEDEEEDDEDEDD